MTTWFHNAPIKEVIPTRDPYHAKWIARCHTPRFIAWSSWVISQLPSWCWIVSGGNLAGRLTFPPLPCLLQRWNKETPLRTFTHLYPHRPRVYVMRYLVHTRNKQSHFQRLPARQNTLTMALPSRATGNRIIERVCQWMAEAQNGSFGVARWCTRWRHQVFIRQYEERVGIVLQPSEMRKNPGRKSTAKLMLNSFWGKIRWEREQTCHPTTHQPCTSLWYPRWREQKSENPPHLHRWCLGSGLR